VTQAVEELPLRGGEPVAEELVHRLEVDRRCRLLRPWQSRRGLGDEAVDRRLVVAEVLESLEQ
jgi:hypothetical protein